MAALTAKEKRALLMAETVFYLPGLTIRELASAMAVPYVRLAKVTPELVVLCDGWIRRETDEDGVIRFYPSTERGMVKSAFIRAIKRELKV